MSTIKITPRKNLPDWLKWSLSPLAVIAALLTSAVFLLILGHDPIFVYGIMFLQPFTSISGISNIVLETVPLLMVGLAVYLPLRAGLWNIGGDGQFYLGAIAATWVGLYLSVPNIALIPAMMLAAMVAGGIWGFVPGYLRAKWGVNEILVTLFMTLIGIQLNQYMIQGPLQGTGGYPASETLSPEASLQSFGSTRLHLGVIVALVILFVVYFLLERTSFGLQVSFVGSNPGAARQSGVSTKKIIIYTMLLGGVFAGLAGMIQLAAEAGRLQAGLSTEYGFTAVAIALLGMKGPFRVLLASIFFGLLNAGAISVASTTAIDISIINIIQALVILFILTTSFIENYGIEINQEVL